jgi:hypothetical protein
MIATIPLIVLLGIGNLLNPTPRATVCEPPPKKTVTIPCGPHEGCEEKWVFVERELPLS